MVRFILFILVNVFFPSPLKWEVKNDAYGEKKNHPNYDWQRRTVLCVLSGIMIACSLAWIEHHGVLWVTLNSIRYGIITAIIFISIFPYVINYVHLKNGVTKALIKGQYYEFKFLTKFEIAYHVINHLSDSAIPDKWDWYRKLGGVLRLLIYFLMLITAIISWFL